MLTYFLHSYEEGLPLKELLYLFQSRIDYILKFSPNAKIMINIRDAPTAYFDNDKKYRERLKTVVEAACLLKPKLFGIAFEVCIYLLCCLYFNLISEIISESIHSEL